MYYIKNRTSEVYYPQNEYLLQAQHEKILAKKSHVSKLKRLIATLQRDLEKFFFFFHPKNFKKKD